MAKKCGPKVRGSAMGVKHYALGGPVNSNPVATLPYELKPGEPGYIPPAPSAGPATRPVDPNAPVPVPDPGPNATRAERRAYINSRPAITPEQAQANSLAAFLGGSPSDYYTPPPVVAPTPVPKPGQLPAPSALPATRNPIAAPANTIIAPAAPSALPATRNPIIAPAAPSAAPATRNPILAPATTTDAAPPVNPLLRPRSVPKYWAAPSGLPRRFADGGITSTDDKLDTGPASNTGLTMPPLPDFSAYTQPTRPAANRDPVWDASTMPKVESATAPPQFGSPSADTGTKAAAAAPTSNPDAPPETTLTSGSSLMDAASKLTLPPIPDFSKYEAPVRPAMNRAPVWDPKTMPDVSNTSLPPQPNLPVEAPATDEEIDLTDNTIKYVLPKGDVVGKAGKLNFDINNLYKKEFGRDADKQGQAFWRNKMFRHGMGEADIAKQFNDSAEGQEYNLNTDKLNDRQFVHRLYRVMLKTPTPDAGGWDFWENRLKQGMSREDLIKAFKQYVPAGHKYDDDLAKLTGQGDTFDAEQYIKDLVGPKKVQFDTIKALLTREMEYSDQPLNAEGKRPSGLLLGRMPSDAEIAKIAQAVDAGLISLNGQDTFDRNSKHLFNYARRRREEGWNKGGRVSAMGIPKMASGGRLMVPPSIQQQQAQAPVAANIVKPTALAQTGILKPVRPSVSGVLGFSKGARVPEYGDELGPLEYAAVDPLLMERLPYDPRSGGGGYQKPETPNVNDPMEFERLLAAEKGGAGVPVGKDPAALGLTKPSSDQGQYVVGISPNGHITLNGEEIGTSDPRFWGTWGYQQGRREVADPSAGDSGSGMMWVDPTEHWNELQQLGRYQLGKPGIAGNSPGQEGFGEVEGDAVRNGLVGWSPETGFYVKDPNLIRSNDDPDDRARMHRWRSAIIAAMAAGVGSELGLFGGSGAPPVDPAYPGLGNPLMDAAGTGAGAGTGAIPDVIDPAYPGTGNPADFVPPGGPPVDPAYPGSGNPSIPDVPPGGPPSYSNPPVDPAYPGTGNPLMNPKNPLADLLDWAMKNPTMAARLGVNVATLLGAGGPKPTAPNIPDNPYASSGAPGAYPGLPAGWTPAPRPTLVAGAPPPTGAVWARKKNEGGRIAHMSTGGNMTTADWWARMTQIGDGKNPMYDEIAAQARGWNSPERQARERARAIEEAQMRADVNRRALGRRQGLSADARAALATQIGNAAEATGALGANEATRALENESFGRMLSAAGLAAKDRELAGQIATQGGAQSTSRDNANTSANAAITSAGIGANAQLEGARITDSRLRDFNRDDRERWDLNFGEDRRRYDTNFGQRQYEFDATRGDTNNWRAAQHGLNLYGLQLGAYNQANTDRNNHLGNIGRGIYYGSQLPWDAIGRGASSLWDTVGGWFGNQGGRAPAVYAQDGMRMREPTPEEAAMQAAGQGPPTDNIPAVLAPDEFVLNQEAVKIADAQAPGMLEALNKKGLMMRQMIARGGIPRARKQKIEFTAMG